ncbi:CDP-alcohol phosphatidyltransferase family protein [Candidatus Babeliales bacterium]|nr:CDP-alcohol phosphatidyltransferase family protein [Candidatus Babeliales bacterium]
MRKLSFSFLKKLPAKEFRLTISTWFTLFRIVLTPFIVGAMIYGEWGIAFSCFVMASVSDMLDGFLARFLNQRTFLGACLDPLADKLLLVSVFTTLACTDTLPFGVPLWFVGVVLFRELLIVFGFLYIYAQKEGVNVTPRILGKVTTALQMFFIGWLFLCYFFGWMPAKTYYLFFSLIVVMVIISLCDYVFLGMRYCKGRDA